MKKTIFIILLSYLGVMHPQEEEIQANLDYIFNDPTFGHLSQNIFDLDCTVPLNYLLQY